MEQWIKGKLLAQSDVNAVSYLEQVANVQCAQANSASYPQLVADLVERWHYTSVSCNDAQSKHSNCDDEISANDKRKQTNEQLERLTSGDYKPVICWRQRQSNEIKLKWVTQQLQQPTDSVTLSFM